MWQEFITAYNYYFSSTEGKMAFALTFFLGLTLGWFFRRFNLFFVIIGLCLFAPILDLLIVIDHWFFTLPFVTGFLVHTIRPIMDQIKR